MKKPELIAPAGSLRKLKYALQYGADAVYLGMPDFSLRARINDFNLSRLQEGVEYAHKMNKKVYVTVNIYAHDYHLKKLEDFIKKVKQLKPDALVVSDPGVLKIIKKVYPKAKIHISTQANVTNWQAAKFWYDLGAERIILARELTLKEMSVIHKKVPRLELEIFVHGAMCMSYSGRCILSKWLTGRSANLGDCAHVCRWNFKKAYLEEEERPGELMPVEEDKHGTYIFNSKDLCLIEYLDKIQKAGVKYFKIEGRGKSIFYLATVVRAYRQAIDRPNMSKPEKSKLKKELARLANRGYHTGFLFGSDKFEHLLKERHRKGSDMFVGEVVKCAAFRNIDTQTHSGKYRVVVRVHNVLRVGERVEVVMPRGENWKFTLKRMIDVKTNKEVKIAHGGTEQKISLVLNKDLPEYSILRKRL